ncbi:hypothetical protein IGB42_03046 [Andreprevotia sp. IGB-42]|uniref:hypothetical protein n=1 Tax=Andreprevotia sp. IGB-42 TaxID=2497473 RepID=UPI001358B23C|nr:hypothetical protein [Andreprevotia sp. IGB-42]KAF0812378.1 hypothetical protein IGB42_03046 [Andreprevotia sp. IGB-42]
MNHAHHHHPAHPGPAQHNHQNGHQASHQHAHAHIRPQRPTLLAMPSWRRVLLVLPLIAALWLSAWWALS